MSISNRRGMLILISFVLSIEGVSFLIDSHFTSVQSKPNVEVFVDESIVGYKQEQENQYKKSEKQLSNFDPNELDSLGWQSLGFSPKQVLSIIKYKYSLGGFFQSKAQIKSCFVISDYNFNRIEPYIRFSTSTQKNNPTLSPQKSGVSKAYSQVSYDENKENKNIKVKNTLNYFNPNTLTQIEWEALGFSPKQAESILKYKYSVGGSFKNKEQIKKCFVINDYMYNKISPFMDFETKSTLEDTQTTKVKQNLNSITYIGLQEKGITEVIAKRIINFREKLGWYVDFSQLNEVFGLTEKELSVLTKEFTLNSDSFSKRSLKSMQEKELAVHPYTQRYAAIIVSSYQNGGNISSIDKIPLLEKKKILGYFY